MKLANLIDPYAPADGPPPRTLGAFFLWAIRGAFPVIVLASIFAGAVGSLEAFTAVILGLVIDAVLTSGADRFMSDNFWLFALLIGFFMLLRPILMGLGSLFTMYVLGPNVIAMVLSRISRWTLGHSVDFFDSDFAGRIATKENQVARALAEVVVESVNVGAFALISVIASIILMLSIDSRIALVLLVWLVAYFFLIRWFLPRARSRAKARANARAAVTGQLVDTITNIKTVKLFAHDEFEDRATHVAIDKLRDKSLHWGALSVSFRFTLMTLAGVLPASMIGGTAYLWSLGLASEGDIAAAGAISIRLGQMVGWVSFTLMQIYSNLGEVEDGMNTLTPPHGLVDAANATTLKISDARLEFINTSFAYGRDIGGIDRINLTINSGEKLGIVGASGAGKSTLVSSLLRMYDIEGGRILIDGQDISAVTQESLRGNIGMVTQETAMFNRSARDNILYGNPDASDEEMLNAARKAEAHGFIQDLRDHRGRSGYEAYLGERGVKLSGGQRQRIALARAILKDAPILVLDEATSALDSEVEAEIQSALATVMEGKTVLAIAHRLSTIARMDRIVVMDAGRIVEQGTHSALLKKDGLYAKFWNRQSGGFIGIEATVEAAE
ncbi:MAG: ABC transporter ATP-binding protein [Paracoccaceae bacterium]